MHAPAETRWLLLIHQIPPTPPYFRVKVGRRLSRMGAVAIKNSVYVLPCNEQAREDFQWLLREIIASGGEATLCEASLIDGLTDEQVLVLFQEARDSDYGELIREAEQLAASATAGELDPERRAKIEIELTRLRRKLGEIVAIDFFGGSKRASTEELLAGIETRLRAVSSGQLTPVSAPGQGYRGRTWVTRSGINIDRMASAWLIRRFIDPEAQFKFVSLMDYVHAPQELRFDMFQAEFTHEGDLCTFEVLLERTGPHDPALVPLAEIVHDIDLKDAKFGRPETTGIASLIAGVVMAHGLDEERLSRSFALFDDLIEFFRRSSG